MTTTDHPLADSMLGDETAAHWALLEEEADACAVVSARMELMYLNDAARRLTPVEWFTRRCFEVLPVPDGQCVWHCPTVAAVARAREITYCEETVRPDGAFDVILGTAVVPLPAAAGDGARALLLFRRKDPGRGGEAGFRSRLLADARALLARIESRPA